MFVGHYSVSLAAKAAEPRAPLWTYVLGAQLLDVAWSVFIATGIERARVDASLPGSGLDLYDMPWTHSLPGALAWSLAAGMAARWLLKAPARAAVFVGATVFSHWVLDLLVHRPDLALWIGGPKVGLGLWSYPVAEQAIEIGLLAIAGVFWTAERLREGRRAWPAGLFLAALVALQIGSLIAPPGGDRVQMGATSLAAYLGATLLAWLLDRKVVDAGERLPRAAVRA